jgi:hypothetical protein
VRSSLDPALFFGGIARLVDIFHVGFIVMVSLFFFVGLFRGARESLWFWPGFFGLIFWLYLCFDAYAFSNLFVSNVFFAILGVFFMAYALIGTLVGYARTSGRGWTTARADIDGEDIRQQIRDLQRRNQRQLNLARSLRAVSRRGTPADPNRRARARVWEEIERMRDRRADERDSWKDLT